MSTKSDFSPQDTEVEAQKLLPCQHKYFCIAKQRSFWIRMLHKEQLGQHPSFPGSLPRIRTQHEPWKSRRGLRHSVILTLIPKKLWGLEALGFGRRESITSAGMLLTTTPVGLRATYWFFRVQPKNNKCHLVVRINSTSLRGNTVLLTPKQHLHPQKRQRSYGGRQLNKCLTYPYKSNQIQLHWVAQHPLFRRVFPYV